MRELLKGGILYYLKLVTYPHNRARNVCICFSVIRPNVYPMHGKTNAHFSKLPGYDERSSEMVAGAESRQYI